jgi:regulation of enolase protein 1 (concanavalin A-like superfamily)
MNLDSSEFTTHNVASNFKLPENLDYFALTASPNTRICRNELSRDQTTAPMMLTRLSHPLVVAEVTITADFEMEWDQAGLIVFTGAPPSQTPPSPAVRRRRYQSREEDVQEGKWVKAGLEFTAGAMNASSVVASSASGGDWSLSPLLYSELIQDSYDSISFSLRIKFERIGDALWIWYRNADGSSVSVPRTPEAIHAEWRKLREVNGFFRGVDLKGDVWVGCYASRPVHFVATDDWDERFGLPESGEGRGLTVEFEDLEIL